MDNMLRNQYTPDWVSPPGETLLETIESLGITQKELADRMGRPKKTVNEIVKGKAIITSETALQLEKVLNVPARFWLNRELQYRESLARQAEQQDIEAQISWLEQIPVAEMVQQGWISAHENLVDQMRNVLNFFAVTSPREWQEVWFNPEVVFRKSLAFSSQPGSLAAWLRQGEIEAQSVFCQPYSKAAFSAALAEIRTLTRQDPMVFEPQMRSLCAAAGVAIVLLPQLNDAKISGATRWLTKEKALIQLSLRYRSDDQFWFSFFHEASHILLHGKRDVFFENGEEVNIQKQKEAEANCFAATYLIPPEKYKTFLAVHSSRYFSKDAIREFSQEVNIAPGIVVGRLQHDGHLPQTHCNDLKIRFDWAKVLLT